MEVGKLLKLMALWDYVLITDAITADEFHIGRVEKVPEEIRAKEAYAIHVNEDMMIHIEVSNVV